MVRIIDCCCDNLNHKADSFLNLKNDVTNEITISTTPVILLAASNIKRKFLKVYILSTFNPLNLIWLQHGIDFDLQKFSFALPANFLYTTSEQASQPLSAYCVEGSALIRLTVTNSL